MPNKNLAIMFTDIKGFTERVSGHSREGMDELLKEHERLLVPVFRHYRGTVAKTIGDAFLVHFESPTDSVLCGLAVQEVLRQYNGSVDDEKRISVRVAINVGEVSLKGNDVFGEPVNIAARLEGITEAGQVYFTESVYLSMNRNEVPTAEVGERTFKGIPYPVRVYRTVWDPNAEQIQSLAKKVRLTSRGPVIHSARRSAVQAVLKFSAALLLVAGLAALGHYYAPYLSREPVIQVAFLLDSSSGCEGILHQAKSSFWKIATELANARQRDRSPSIEFAVYEYGNNNLREAEGFTRQASPLAADLDKVAKNLTRLEITTTPGSSEFCGYAIQRAVDELKWNRRRDAYRAIFICGNEQFAQGPVKFRNAIENAVGKGVVVNTVFFGNYDAGVRLNWRQGAQVGGGEYLILRPDAPPAPIEAPQDEEIRRLGEKLNETVVPIGPKGQQMAQIQYEMDAFAEQIGSAADRQLFKATPQYGASRWDAVSRVMSGKVRPEKLNRKDLPDEFRTLGDAELAAKINEKADQRRAIQNQLRDLAVKRRDFVAGKELLTDGSPWEQRMDSIVMKAIRKQIASKGFAWP